MVENKALLSNFNIDLVYESSSDSESMNEPMNDDTFVQELVPSVMMNSFLSVLSWANEFNWFALIDHIESEAQFIDYDLIARIFLHLLMIPVAIISENKSLLILSKEAFEAAKHDEYEQDRIARIINGEVVLELESDDPENFPKVESILSDKGRKQILKKRMLIKRHAQIEKLKGLQNKGLCLVIDHNASAKLGKNVQILETLSGNVGADAWCRTGVLTLMEISKILQR